MDEYMEGEPLKTFENTYRLEPHKGKKFSSSKIKEIITNVLNEMLEEKKYDPVEAPELSKKICDKIREQAKALECPRYKLIVQATVGEIKGQTVRVASRCLWDTGNDNYASDSYRNSSLWATAIVFGVYFE
eukprot:GFYU01003351.1.p1 GENE.GFYU01003351.1~~GFYU01003351.1.p1  ORF type:complete len:131 (+),score=38.23 GFYU01003351.1:109-501(+)